MPRNLREYMVEKIYPQVPGKKRDFVHIVICSLKVNITTGCPLPVLTNTGSELGQR